MVGTTGDSWGLSMRVLAFEDRVDIEALLISGAVSMDGLLFEQRWTSEDALQHIDRVRPDVLLLDHFMPPMTGLEVLDALLNAVDNGSMTRPGTIVAMSSEPSCNDAMVARGADHGIVKPHVAILSVWS